MTVVSFFIVLLLSSSLVPSGIPSARAVEFAADQTIRTDGRVYRGNLYYRDDMWRIEHNNPSSIEVTIVRKDKGLIWLLQGRTRRFATMPFDDSADVMLERTLARETGRELIGTEVLDGHPTTLF